MGRGEGERGREMGQQRRHGTLLPAKTNTTKRKKNTNRESGPEIGSRRVGEGRGQQREVWGRGKWQWRRSGEREGGSEAGGGVCTPMDLNVMQ
jgi:hypothetical protein